MRILVVAAIIATATVITTATATSTVDLQHIPVFVFATNSYESLNYLCTIVNWSANPALETISVGNFIITTWHHSISTPTHIHAILSKGYRAGLFLCLFFSFSRRTQIP